MESYYSDSLRMKRIVFILPLLFQLACSQRTQNGTIETQHTFQYAFVDVILDSTSTWGQIIDAANIFTDSLFVLAGDENNGPNRLAAQEWGYTTIYLLTEVYEQKLEEGEDVKFSDISPILERINNAVCLWITTEMDGNVYVWRDHYYACHQQAEEPVKGFFNFMIKISDSDPQTNTMRITFPKAAHKDYPPMLAFRTIANDGYSEVGNYEDYKMLGEELRIRDDIDVMYADVDGDVVDMMLKYDYMYIMFRSVESDKGDQEKFEIARVGLFPFKEKWNNAILNTNK